MTFVLIVLVQIGIVALDGGLERLECVVQKGLPVGDVHIAVLDGSVNILLIRR